MPPSPSLRISPGKECKETAHKRGRSFESSLPLKSKDDDLVLFTDMQNRERDSFLLQTSEDFDESISRLRYFPDLKLGITIPTRGESSDLLNADGGKNDYDWLLTPPDTPLFPSLDDEEPQTISRSPRGRVQSQPRSISRSSTNERGPRSSRSSASPNRLSPSPRSGSSALQSRSRPSPASRSSPPPVLRPSMPSRRPLTPPTKPSTPPRRSASPTPRRMSTGSGGQPFASGRRGTSPVKPNRGASSPKMQGWQTGLPGFSSDAPPNLRTSLSDRSVSRSRGLSPASTSGTDSTLKFRRQSTSPTPSRSASSSHSLERDNFSSYGKASVVSAGDDEVDSMYSLSTRIAGNPAARNNTILMKSKNITLSKKPSKNILASSAPKRSFDSALWLMDHRKAPQNMFRPLLSSVPSSTFCVGKANSLHRPTFSRNSSITTSSNASSEHGAANDVAGEWEKVEGSDIQEEVFLFEKVEEINEDTSSDCCAVKHQCGTGKPNEGKMDKTHKLESTIVDFCEADLPSILVSDGSGVDFLQRMGTCSSCGKRFCIMQDDGDSDVCEECAAKDGHVATESKFGNWNEANPLTALDAQTPQCVELHLPRVPELSDNDKARKFLDRLEGNGDPWPDCLAKSGLPKPMLDMRELKNQIETDLKLNGMRKQSVSEPSTCAKFQQLESAVQITEQKIFEQHMGSSFDLESDSQNSAIISKPDADEEFQQAETTASQSIIRVDNPEGSTGISVLLQRSSSSRWPVLEGRSFVSSNILCSEPYYARENANAMKHSIGRDSSSASSVDLGSSRLTEARVQRYVSTKRAEIDKALINHWRRQSTGSVSDMSICSSPVPLDGPKNETNEDFSSIVDCGELKTSRMTTSTGESEDSFKKIEMPDIECSSIGQTVTDKRSFACENSCFNSNATDSHMYCQQEAENIVVEGATEEPCQSSKMHCGDIELPSYFQHSSLDEEGHLPKTLGRDEASVDATDLSSNAILEHPMDNKGIEDPPTLCEPSPISSNAQMFHESCEGTSDGNVSAPERVSNIAESPPHHAEEDPSIPAEPSRWQMQRSFTLEEATDTILFCSSIIHDLAYKAATISMEKDSALPEAPWPTVTLLPKSSPKQDDRHKALKNRGSNPRKVKRKRLETETSTPRAEKEEVAESSISASSTIEAPAPKAVDSMKPPKLESKCNCTIM